MTNGTYSYKEFGTEIIRRDFPNTRKNDEKNLANFCKSLIEKKNLSFQDFINILIETTNETNKVFIETAIENTKETNKKLRL